MSSGHERRPDVVLLAHGSPDPRHTQGISRLVGRAAAAASHLVFHAAYLDHHPPQIPDVAASLGTGDGPIVLVPLLLTRAFHARVDVPAAARDVDLRTGRRVRVTLPLSPHPLLGNAVGELLDQRAEDRALVMLGGSSRSGAVDDLVAELRGTLPPVRAYAFATLDGHLPLDAAIDELGGPERAVGVGGILADGVLRDRMVRGCAERGIPFAAGVLADTDAIVRIILARVGEAGESPTHPGGSPQL